MQVKVLQHHIDEGKRGSATRCAVAMALREQFPELDARRDIVVGALAVRIGDTEWRHDGQDFVSTFDKQGPGAVSPRTVTLRDPAPR